MENIRIEYTIREYDIHVVNNYKASYIAMTSVVCRRCCFEVVSKQNKFTALEAVLQSFRSMAKSVCIPRQLAPSCRKRVKDTSGVGVSPHAPETKVKAANSW